MRPMMSIVLATASFSFAGGVPSPSVDSTSVPVLVATPGSSKVALKWSLCPSCDSYEVFRSTASSGPWTSIARIQGTVAHTDTGLVSRSLYFYRVSGFRSGIEGDFSDVLQVITLDSLSDSAQAKKPAHP